MVLRQVYKRNKAHERQACLNGDREGSRLHSVGGYLSWSRGLKSEVRCSIGTPRLSARKPVLNMPNANFKPMSRLLQMYASSVHAADKMNDADNLIEID